MAEVMGAEAALVRTQLVSGTHAIATALFAVLRPGDELLAVAGKPYDTLEEVIGLRGTPGKPSISALAQHLPIQHRGWLGYMLSWLQCRLSFHDALLACM